MRTEVRKSGNSEKKANRKESINRQTKTTTVEREGRKAKILKMQTNTAGSKLDTNKQRTKTTEQSL